VEHRPALFHFDSQYFFDKSRDKAHLNHPMQPAQHNLIMNAPTTSVSFSNRRSTIGMADNDSTVALAVKLRRMKRKLFLEYIQGADSPVSSSRNNNNAVAVYTSTFRHCISDCTGSSGQSCCSEQSCSSMSSSSTSGQ
jgi:hypothetical protein